MAAKSEASAAVSRSPAVLASTSSASVLISTNGTAGSSALNACRTGWIIDSGRPLVRTCNTNESNSDEN